MRRQQVSLGSLPVAHRINQSFRQSPYASFRGLDVAEIDGTVVLTGTVPTYYLKQMAQVLAQKVEGVRRLENRTTVRRH